MFTICKTVKVYNIEKHYHFNDRTYKITEKKSELDFMEQTSPPQFSEAMSIRSIQSQTIRTQRKHGISLSLVDSKKMSSSQKKLSVTSSKKYLKRESTSKAQYESQLFTKKDKAAPHSDIPINVQSKIINPQELFSPKLIKSERQYLSQQQIEFYNLNLQNKFSLSTNQSMRLKLGRQNSQTLENSIRKKQQSGIKMIDSFRNINLKKVEDKSNPKASMSSYNYYDQNESLMKLSTSSISINSLKQKLSNFNKSQSGTVSLQIQQNKKSQNLEELVDNIYSSIIPTESNRHLKPVQSNQNILKDTSYQYDFNSKPARSYIMQKQCNSPLKKLRALNGQSHLLKFSDKDTIVSKSLKSDKTQKVLFDESIMMEHQLSDTFKQLGLKIQHQNYQNYLALESQTHLIVLIKQFSLEHMHQVNLEVSIYHQIEKLQPSIGVLKLYQVLLNNQKYNLIKQPYESTLQNYFYYNSQNCALLGWNIILTNILNTISKTLSLLLTVNVFPVHFLTVNDIVQVLGQWKLHSLDKFRHCCPREQRIQINDVLFKLEEEINAFLGGFGDQRPFAKK